jgi:hypothetical protein
MAKCIWCEGTDDVDMLGVCRACRRDVERDTVPWFGKGHENASANGKSAQKRADDEFVAKIQPQIDRVVDAILESRERKARRG